MFEDFWKEDKRTGEFYCYNDCMDGNSVLRIVTHISKEEHNRFYRTFELPLKTAHGTKVYFNHQGRFHRIDGSADFCNRKSVKFPLQNPYERYFLNGILMSKQEWLEARKDHILKRIIFSRKNKNTLKKLLYIPELFQNVFYANKRHFISLLQKL